MKRILKSAFCSALALGAFTSAAQAQWTLESLWTLSPDDAGFLTTDHTQRGMAYNPVSGNLLLVDRSAGLQVVSINAATGTQLGTLDITGISGGTFPLNKIGVGADGSIYAGNLTVDALASGNEYRLYRWENEAAAPQEIFAGNPGPADYGELHAWARRWGDTIHVRGGVGSDVEVLVGSRNDALATIFTVSGGSVAGSNVLETDMSNQSGHWYNGIAFGEGETFWGSRVDLPLVRMGYDPANNTAETLDSFGADVFPIQVGPVGVDPVNGFIGGLRTGGDTVPQETFLYRWTDEGGLAPQTEEGDFLFPTQNGNGNGAGDVVFDSETMRMWVLGTNNGIMAFQVIPEPRTYALTFGIAMLGVALFRRRFRK